MLEKSHQVYIDLFPKLEDFQKNLTSSKVFSSWCLS